MSLRRGIPILIAVALFSRSVLAQKGSAHVETSSSTVDNQGFEKTVLPITDLKLTGVGVGITFGTGFCLDAACRFIGTNYHVAAVAHPLRIKGQKVVARYLATGPQDEGATLNDSFSSGVEKYTVSRDLAIFELRHGLPQHHGIAFSQTDLQIGQDVDICAYPKEGVSPFRKLVKFHGKFNGQTPSGLLAFNYNLSGDKAIRPGASGGIVVDSKSGKIVAILSQMATNELVALAVPVRSLVEFVSKVQPYLAQAVFPHRANLISPLAPDFYPKFVKTTSDTLQHRPEEPAAVKILRSKAQHLADSIRNFVAVQNVAWGSGDNEPSAWASFELQVLDGYQKFREYPDGKVEFEDMPLPSLSNAVSNGGEWSMLPEMVGTELDLKIQQAPDAVVNGRKVKVFQYRADPEDKLCVFKDIMDFVFFSRTKVSSLGCYGEVWTDDDSILRISEHLEMRRSLWSDNQSVVTYGWLRRTNDSPKLVPLTIATQARHGKKVFWCRGQFTDYHEFRTNVRLLSGGVQ